MDSDEYSETINNITSIKNVSNSEKKRKVVSITDGKSSDIIKQEMDEDQGSPKKIPTGWKMMYNMGFTEGTGLGAKGQGITEPIAPNTQQSKRGLGSLRESVVLEMPKTKWKDELDPASATRDIVVSIDGERLFYDERNLISGLEIGDRLVSIDDETYYCDPKLLAEMVKGKTMLDQFSILDGRSRSNPYEKIGAGIFLNRAAMKMANIDSVTDGLLTTTENDETLFFADICAGPGGFTEYMLWRKQMQSCGFGFTLKDSNDFRLMDIVCGPVECFHPSYGQTDNGDIFIEANLRKFQQEVLSGTGSRGVHVVLADGGFSVEGHENIQEILSKQLYLCQFLCAINILRAGGHFLCKLFDTLTDFSAGLIFLVSTLFNKVSIIKPITSRPANSERYILFQQMCAPRERLDAVREYLYEVNRQVTDLKDTPKDVMQLVPRQWMKMDEDFYQFLKCSNDKIMDQQSVALAKLISFVQDRNLVDQRQNDIRTEALRLWKVPDLLREHYKNIKSSSTMNRFINVDERNQYGALLPTGNKSVQPLVDDEFRKDKFVVRNCVAGLVSRTMPEMGPGTLVVMVKDKRVVRCYGGHGEGVRPQKLSTVQRKWLPSVPSFTLLLVHFSIEYGGHKGNQKVNSITVVDGAMIYGEDISQMAYEQRMAKVANLCRLLDPKAKGHIKPLEFFPLLSLPARVKERVSIKCAKGLKNQAMYSCTNQDRSFPPGSLLIVHVVKDPWMVAISRSSGTKYYYNVLTRESLAKRPNDIDASYSESTIHELDWPGRGDQFLALLQQKAS